MTMPMTSTGPAWAVPTLLCATGADGALVAAAADVTAQARRIRELETDAAVLGTIMDGVAGVSAGWSAAREQFAPAADAHWISRSGQGYRQTVADLARRGEETAGCLVDLRAALEATLIEVRHELAWRRADLEQARAAARAVMCG